MQTGGLRDEYADTTPDYEPEIPRVPFASTPGCLNKTDWLMRESKVLTKQFDLPRSEFADDLEAIGTALEAIAQEECADRFTCNWSVFGCFIPGGLELARLLHVMRKNGFKLPKTCDELKVFDLAFEFDEETGQFLGYSEDFFSTGKKTKIDHFESHPTCAGLIKISPYQRYFPHSDGYFRAGSYADHENWFAQKTSQMPTAEEAIYFIIRHQIAHNRSFAQRDYLRCANRNGTASLGIELSTASLVALPYEISHNRVATLDLQVVYLDEK